jgi:hypothetical protein
VSKIVFGVIRTRYSDASRTGSFVDRDMMMRYHWGSGIGHVYSHASRFDSLREKSIEQDLEEGGLEVVGDSVEGVRQSRTSQEATQLLLVAGDDPEFGLEERENEDLGDSSDDSINQRDRDRDDSDSDGDVLDKDTFV